ncbi:hypothetical protein PFICI_09780 [Pestalotiopsis fici W106-1]|uniref:FAD-binding domain-containing protein n=1 Tax=Pestalotiopsis fici (strain W106-1 / CGMCC3.15140) TaxID=1229662 RepID=W3WV34_PESFW|nr:uncharacterized protein PFICI_09780 [Pestalotiopsis fici W106-1]ETS77718.1 hypothetical protein PFICI_09780 [Pestalotiopsis fici W106-1]
MEAFKSSPSLKTEPDNDEYSQGSTKTPNRRQSRPSLEKNMDERISTIRVAIIGGGLAGAVLARGLLRYSHIAVDLYEARPSCREERPSMDLSPLSQVILHAIDPSMDDCLGRAGAVYTTSEVRIATGSLAGQRLHVNDQFTNGNRTVGRQALLSEILSGIPPRMVHLNAKVTSISQSSPGPGLTLAFSDGSQKKYDVVIGADGVRGLTRNYIVGPDDPTQTPKPSGLWTLPIKVPTDKARQMIESEVLDPRNPRQITWVGDGTMMQHGLMSNGREVQVTTAAIHQGSTEESSSWVKLFTPSEYQQIFSSSQSLPCQGIVKLVQSIYTISIAAFCHMQYLPTRTYASRNACLIDGAAHGSSSSASLYCPSNTALEEALILSTLLGRTTSRAHVAAALRAYDEVCRPRAELVMRTSADIGMLLSGCGPGVGLDPGRLAEALEQAFGMIEGLDIKAYCIMAIEIMDRLSHAKFH